MNKNNKDDLLRQRAKAKLKESGARIDIPSSKKDLEDLIYELQVQNMQLKLEQEEKEQEVYQYKYLLEGDSDFILITDVKGIITYINKYGEGLSAEEVIGMNILDFMPNKEMKTLTGNALDEVVKNKVSVSFENKAIVDDEGNIRSFFNKVDPILKQDGSLKGVVLRAVDVTDVQHAKKELILSKEHFKAITQQHFKAITIADLEGNYTFVNPAFCDMMGYSEEELLTLSVFDMKAEANHQVIFDVAKNRTTEGTVLLKRKDGSTFLSRVNGKPISINGESFVLGVVADITEEEKKEGELEESKHQLENLFELSPDLMFKIKIDTLRFVAINQHVVDRYGYTKEEFLNMTVFDIEENRSSLDFAERLRERLGVSKTVQIEGVHKRKDGTTFLVSINIARLDENFIVAAARDVTLMKEVEQNLSYANETLELALEGSSAGVWDWRSIEEETMWCSPQFYRLLGYEFNEILFTTSLLTEWHHPSQRETVLALMKSHFLNDTPYDIEVRLKTKSGDYKWFRTTAKGKRDEQGKVVRMIGSIVDIDLRKKIEEKNKYYQNILEQSQEIAKIGSWELDLGANVLIWTDEAYRVFGVPLRTPLTYEVFLNQIHPDDRDYVNQEWTKAVEGNLPYDIEHRLVVDGKIKWVREKATIYYGEDGNPTNAIGFTQDITYFKEIEEQLKESEKRYRDLFDNINDGIAMLDANGYVLYCNEAYARVCGYSDRESMENVSIPDIVYPEDRASSEQAFKELREKGAYEGYEGRLFHEGKPVTWVRVSSTAIYNEEGVFVGSRDVVRDITSVKSATLKVKEAKEQFENLFELSPDFMFKSRISDSKLVEVNQRACHFYGYTKEEFKQLYISDLQTYTNKGYGHIPIGHVVEVERNHRKKDGTIFPVQISYCKLDEDYILAIARDITLRKQATKEAEDLRYALDEASIVAVTDNTGKIISVNDRFSDVSKYSRDELIGNTHEILNSEYHPKSFWTSFWATISEGNIWSGEIKNKTKDGNYYWTQGSIIPFLDDSGKPIQYIAIRTDITEQKELETALRIAKEEADKNARIKENFLANMSHEIRTPMNGVLGFSRLLLEMDSSATQKKYAQSIYSSAENLLVVINDILDVSKMESGRFEIQNSGFNLADKIKSVLEILQVALDEKGLDLVVEIDEKIPTCIVAASNRIAQVLINLVNNAIKFTKEGTVHLKVNLQEEKVLLFEIIDTGIGIPEDKWDTIFGSFIQIENYITREHKGTGLGLSICKELVGLMGGAIGLKSKVGEGSTFYFTIPFAFCSEGEESSMSKEDVLLRHLKINSGVNVLVAEDHPVNRELAIIYLNLINCSYELVDNGIDAVKKAKDTRFDAILMDIQMPQMDGIEATKQIRTFDKETPIIAMTAHALEKEKQQCLKIGMNDYLTKPFRIEELEELIIKYAKKETKKINEVVHASVKDIDGDVSFSEVLAEMGGDQNLVNDLLSIFKVEIVKFIDEMKAAIDLEDWAQMRGLKHRIKPSFDLFRFREQKEYLIMIGILIKEEKDINEMKNYFQLLEETIPSLMKEIDIELLKSTN